MPEHVDHVAAPDHTAARVALWRARHLEVDAAPPVVADDVGLRLLDPEPGWRDRPDMDAVTTRGLRAAIVSRTRFVDDLVTEHAARGVDQYVVLGAGLDSLAQRRDDLAPVRVFEVEQPGTSAWKRRRLDELGLGVRAGLHLVPVDVEGGESWSDAVIDAGFDPARPAVVAAAGVSMYLARATTAAILRTVAGFAPGTTLAVTFLLPLELLADGDRDGLRRSAAGAQAAGTPFASFYTPAEMLALARDAGFASARHVPGTVLADRYFGGRPDGLRPSTGEDVLLAWT